MAAINVTGWNEISNGSLLQAVNVLLGSYYGDWWITLIFIIFKYMIYTSSENNYLGFILTAIFLIGFGSSLTPILYGTIIAIGIIELGAVIYEIIFKDKI